MTVEELVEKLSYMDPNAVVLIADWNEGWADPAPLAVVSNECVGRVVLDA